MRNTRYPGMIVRQKLPLNLEYPFYSLHEWLIPADHFFVRSHFPAPRLDEETWCLKVYGTVEREVEFRLADLRALPATTLTATVECAGNGRVFYEPAREGLQWQTGAVGNAEWTGVTLRTVIERAGIAPEAQEVVLIGADQGPVDTGKKTASPGAIAFARSLPMDKALADGTLLAYAMNGEPLTVQHGYPLRAVVGGWFGMAWVKWLTELRVVDRPFLGYWQARDYFTWERHCGEPTLTPLTQMAIKAQIAQPVTGSVLHAGEPCRVFGAAWSGEIPLSHVEVCVQGGLDWHRATLLSTAADDASYAWRLWEYYWTPPEPGAYTLVCRATDAEGNTQPATQQTDRESYMANWIVPVDVTVVAGPTGSEDNFVI